MKRNSPPQELECIEEMVRHRNAPVKEFERSIRTSPLRTLISILLSSRTKDQVTLEASKKLFQGIGNSQDLSQLSVEEIEKRIYPVGFYRQKAMQIKKIALELSRGRELKADRESLMALPGVGRKTANLVLALAFDSPAIAVDIHVFRISRRLGWCKGNTVQEVEAELMQIFHPRKEWTRLNQSLVAFGQTICRPRNPLCGECLLNTACPSAE